MDVEVGVLIDVGPEVTGVGLDTKGAGVDTTGVGPPGGFPNRPILSPKI